MTPTWEPGIGDHLRTIWHYKWFIIGAAVVIAEGVFLLLSSLPMSYEAESSIRLSDRSDAGLLLDSDRMEYASRVYAELAESPAVLTAAVAISGVSIDVGDAADALDVDWTNPPGFIDITATANSSRDAALLADGMAEAIIALVADDVGANRAADGAAAGSDDVTDTAEITLTASLVEPAIEPQSAASPRPARDAFAAFLIALVVLAEAAALWRPARGLLPLSRTAERVSELVGIPALTLTGEPEDRTRLALFASRHLAVKSSVLIVHCNGEPLPAVPVKLAEAVTAGGRPTLVIDGERSEPNLHRRLGLPQGPGLNEVMLGHERLRDAVFKSTDRSDLALLTAGGTDGTRQHLAADDALERLGSDYDFVIVNVGSTTLLDGVASAVAEQPRSTILVFDPQKAKRRDLGDLVHGFGGHEEVAAILLVTKSAGRAETRRLADRWWQRRSTNESGPARATEPGAGQRRVQAGRAS